MTEESKDSVEYILCGCGCGLKIPKYNKWGYQRKYAFNHYLRGFKHSNETKLKLSKIGKGLKRSEQTRKRLSEAKVMEKNSIWQDDKVGYAGIHSWVKRHFWKTRLCQKCLEVPPYDLANITNIYKRDFKNWRYFCRKCHMKSDNRLINLRGVKLSNKNIDDKNNILF